MCAEKKYLHHKKIDAVYLFIIGLYLIKQTNKFFEEKETTFLRRNFPLKYSIKLRLGLNIQIVCDKGQAGGGGVRPRAPHRLGAHRLGAADGVRARLLAAEDHGAHARVCAVRARLLQLVSGVGAHGRQCDADVRAEAQGGGGLSERSGRGQVHFIWGCFFFGR